MKTMNLKQKIKDHKVEIAVGVSALIGVAVAASLAKKTSVNIADDSDGILVVGELVSDAATGEPLHLLTTFGAFDLTPHVEK